MSWALRAMGWPGLAALAVATCVAGAPGLWAARSSPTAAGLAALAFAAVGWATRRPGRPGAQPYARALAAAALAGALAQLGTEFRAISAAGAGADVAGYAAVAFFGLLLGAAYGGAVSLAAVIGLTWGAVGRAVVGDLRSGGPPASGPVV